MTTLETLFMQILDRRKRIVDQLKSHVHSYDQSLASNLLIHGIPPPPWLWASTGFDPGIINAKELKREALISGLLYPPPHPKVSLAAGNFVCYGKQAINAERVQLSESLVTETCASSKYFVSENVPTAVPRDLINEHEPFHAHCTNEVPELDPSPASHRIQMNEQFSDMHYESDQSLALFQRSRSRQKALEFRNSAKSKMKRRSLKENIRNEYSGRVTRSRAAHKHGACIRDSQKSKESSSISKNCGVTDPGSNGANSVALDKELTREASSNRVREDDIHQVAGTDINVIAVHAFDKGILSSGDANDISKSRTCATEIAETHVIPDAPDAAETLSSELKMCNMNDGFEVSVSRLASYANTLVEPRQLKFDDMEEYSFNQVGGLPLEEEKQESFLEMRALAVLPAQSVKGENISKDFQAKQDVLESLLPSESPKREPLFRDFQGTGDFVAELMPATIVQGTEISNGEVEALQVSNEGQVEVRFDSIEAETNENKLRPVSSTCKLLSPSAPSLKKRSSILSASSLENRSFFSKETCGDVLAETVSVNNGTSKQKEVTTYLALPSEQVQGKGPLGGQLPAREDLDLPSIKIASQIVNSADQKLAGRLSVEPENKLCPVSSTCKLLSPSAPSLKKRSSIVSAPSFENRSFSSKETCGDALAETVSVNNCTSKQKEVTKYLALPSKQVQGKGPLGGQLPAREDLDLPSIKIASQIVNSADQKLAGRLSVEPPMTLPTIDMLAVAASNNHQVLMSTIFNDSDPKTSGILLESHDTECNASAVDTEKGSAFEQAVTPKSGQMQNQEPRYFLRSSSGHGRNIGHYASAVDTEQGSDFEQAVTPNWGQTQNQEPRYFLRSSSGHERNDGYRKSNVYNNVSKSRCLDTSSGNACEISWPMCKRRKTEGQSNNVFNTSTRVRRPKSHLQLIHKNNVCGVLDSYKTASETTLEFQQSPSQDLEVGQLKEVIAGTRVELTKGIDDACQTSWPMYKRRKIKDQSNNALNTCPRVRRGKPHLQLIQEKNIRCSLNSSKNVSEVILKFQPSPSHEIKVQQLNVVTESPGLETCQSQEHCKMEGPELVPALQLSVSRLEKADGDSQNCLKVASEVAAEPTSLLEVKRQSTSNDGIDSLGNEERQEDLKCSAHSERYIEDLKSHVSDQGPFSSYCGRTSCIEDVDFINSDKSMPEFEGFSVGLPPEVVLANEINFDELDISSIAKERTSALEQLFRSTSLLTPLAYPLTKNKIHMTPDVCQSLPNGLLEHLNLRKALFNVDGDKQLMGNEDDDSADVSHNSSSMIETSLMARSYSDSMSFFNGYLGQDVSRHLYTPPPGGKIYQSIISKSSGNCSEKQVSLNPEFTCFRIDEDTSLDEIGDPLQQGTENISSKGEALVDATSEYQYSSTFVSGAGKFPERDSMDSVNTEFSSLGTRKCVRKIQNGYGKDGRYRNEDKENLHPSMSGFGARKANELHPNRSSRSKLSEQASEKQGSEAFLDKGCKRDNIVSNISSFIPIVQQKQASTVLAGKRDIKVKALEAAEAARRLEEKRDNERKMRKEAAKLERVKQETIRQLEMKKKQEEQKKKEADMAARKRQREEEDKKEKERKRKCIEEARRQQREHGEKLRAEKEEKELQKKAADERKKRELAEQPKKQLKRDKGCKNGKEVEPTSTMLATGNGRDTSSGEEDREASKMCAHVSKVANDLDSLHKANNGISVTEESYELQSYEMSPYQGSDDEEEEEDDNGMVEKKFIPTWARSKCLAQSLPSLRHIDPTKIFTRERCVSLNEVILPRRHKAS